MLAVKSASFICFDDYLLYTEWAIRQVWIWGLTLRWLRYFKPSVFFQRLTFVQIVISCSWIVFICWWVNWILINSATIKNRLLNVHYSWIFPKHGHEETHHLQHLTDCEQVWVTRTFSLRVFVLACVTGAPWCSEERRDRQQNISYLWQYVCIWKEGESFTIHVPWHTPRRTHLGENKVVKVVSP